MSQGSCFRAQAGIRFPGLSAGQENRETRCCFPSLPRPVLPKPHTTAVQGKGAPGPFFGSAGMGWVCRAQRCALLLTAPSPSARAALGKQSPHFLGTRMQPMLVPLVWEELCQWLLGSCAPQLVTGTSQCVGPSCPEAFHTSGQGVWGGGCSWKGSAGSCSLPAVICQIISLQPAQMLLVLRVCLGCWKSSRGPHRSAWCPHPGVCSLHSSCPTQHGPSAHSPRRKQQLCRVSCFTTTPPGVLGEPQDRGTLPQPC